MVGPRLNLTLRIPFLTPREVLQIPEVIVLSHSPAGINPGEFSGNCVLPRVFILLLTPRGPSSQSPIPLPPFLELVILAFLGGLNTENRSHLDPKQSSGHRFTTSPTHSGFTVAPGLQAVCYKDTPSCLCVAYVPVWKACLRWCHRE